MMIGNVKFGILVFLRVFISQTYSELTIGVGAEDDLPQIKSSPANSLGDKNVLDLSDESTLKDMKVLAKDVLKQLLGPDDPAYTVVNVVAASSQVVNGFAREVIFYIDKRICGEIRDIGMQSCVVEEADCENCMVKNEGIQAVCYARMISRAWERVKFVSDYKCVLPGPDSKYGIDVAQGIAGDAQFRISTFLSKVKRDLHDPICRYSPFFRKCYLCREQCAGIR